MAKRKQRLDKFGVAAALQEIAALLELKGGTDRFKARAYQTGARVIAAMREDLGEVIKAQSLTSMRGIGNALASQIEQLYLTGESSVLRGLRKDFPPGIVELSGVPGLSITKIKTLHDALGITTVAQLKKAAEAGRISEIKGFGPKSEQRLLETLSEKRRSEKRERRLHIHHAERIADPIKDYLQMGAGVSEVVIAGSLRRRKETVGVIRLVAAAKKPSAVIKHFLNFPLIIQVVSQSDGTCEVVLAEGAKVFVAAVKPDDFPLALITETGSQAHVAKLLSLKNRKARKTTAASTLSPIEKKEAVVYQRLGMQFIPPELREDLGEIEAATSGKLPEDLITSSDIQGMVHCHTTYSDGKHSVEAMAMAAEA
ncbi:MAG TPA: helix-hairpin-helix domain-containing protein, partial [Pyrinomonadaceae bacterium]